MASQEIVKNACVHFASDNTSGVHPKIMQALVDANTGNTMPYGNDPYTANTDTLFARVFGEKARVLSVFSGTASNAVVLNTMLRSWQSILCSSVAHIYTTESAAMEAIIGCRLTPLPHSLGKLTPDVIHTALKAIRRPHHTVPYVLSLAQVTEVGTVYSLAELRALCDTAHELGLLVHMDGARIANAMVALNCSIAELTSDVGVDALSFGGTKNGMMFGELAVFFNEELGELADIIRKQCLQLASKLRFLSVQFDAYFEDDIWLANARQANNMGQLLASRIMKMKKASFVYPTDANGIFVTLEPSTIDALSKKYRFILNETTCMCRFMCGFTTTSEEVHALADAMEEAGA